MSELGRLSDMFDACLQLPEHEREAHARRLCGDDAELQAALLALLDRDQALETADHAKGSSLTGLAGVALSERLMKGRRVGPFEIEECIGTGGMGSVYRVTRIDGEVQQQAALKILKPMVAESGLFKRFSNERRLLASLNHPGICRFLDAGNLPDGQPYVLMELVDGVPLTRWCDRAGLTIRQRVTLFLEVLDAVAYAHRRLVVHRDIKPSNVLVGADGRPRLLDFGIAKQLGTENPELTGTVERYLTPSASAPEQFLGEPVGIGCDLYALGQLLYELLCGLRPFEFANLRAAEVERLLLQVPAPSMLSRLQGREEELAHVRGQASLKALRRALKGDLDTIVLKCLRKRPDERYASVEQLQSELRSVLASRPIRARRQERWYRLQKFIFRNPVPVALGLLLSLSLVASLVMSLIHSSRLDRERAAALLERDRAQYAVGLLQQAFSGADPARTLGAEVTARQILESARVPLNALEASQPALFASLAAVIGEVELDLMMADAAGEMAERGIRAAMASEVPVGVQRQLWSLRARSLTDQLDESLLMAALAELEQIDGQRRADWLYARGRWLLLRDRYVEAAEVLALALDAERIEALEPRLTLDIRTDLAVAQTRAGQPESALETSSATLAWLQEAFGPEHPMLVLGRMRHAETLRRAGRLEEASAHASAVHAKIGELYGERSATAGRAHVLLASLAVQQRNPDLAIKHYQEARAIWLEALGPDHPNHIRLGLNLGDLLMNSEGGAEQAERLLRETYARAARQMGLQSSTVHLSRALLAQLVGRERDGVEAMTILLGGEGVSTETLWAIPRWRQTFEALHAALGCPSSQLSVEVLERCRALAANMQDA